MRQRAQKLYRLALEAWRRGDVADTEERLGAVLADDPRHIDALSDLGALRQSLGRHEEAIVLYESALAVDAKHLRALRNLARAQQHLDRLEQASATLRKLATLDPAESAAYLIRDALLVHKVAPDGEYALAIRRTIADKLAGIRAGGARMTAPLRFPSTYFPLSYHGIANKALLQSLAATHLAACPGLAWQAPHIAAWRPPQRARVGFASHFFRGHSIGNTSRGLIRELDRDAYEVVLVRLGGTRPDAISEEIDRSADRVLAVPYHDLETARRSIAALSLDILFYQDIGLEPLSHLLAFSRLAPVQLTSFGHPDTTGIDSVDYYLSSDCYEPDGAQEHYAERLVLVPGAGTLSYYFRPPPPSGRRRGDFGLRDDEHAYLCAQALFKIHPDMDDIFAGIARADPAAKVVLIDPQDEELRPALERRLGPLMRRILFLPAMRYEDFLSLLARADVILDTLHFNGQNTSLEAFAVGTPVVTLPGALQRGRHTAGMYRAMGFADLVATSRDDYVARAVRVATDPAFSARCRERIAATRDVLYENEAFVRTCEDAFRAMISAKASTPRTR